MKSYYLFPLVIIFTVACTHKQNNKVDFTSVNSYSIMLSEFSDSIYNKLKNSIKDSLYTKTISGDEKLFIGKYKSDFEAGNKAYRLYKKSFIDNYKITFEDTFQVYDKYRFIPFIGLNLNRPSLFKYDLLTKKNEIIWSKWGRKIIDLNYLEEFKDPYFVTALTLIKDTGFPSITEVRVYNYNLENDHVRLIDKLGKGLQIISNRDSVDNFQIYFNLLDSIKSNKIIQLTKSYKFNGKVKDKRISVFDIIKDGFPIIQNEVPQFISPSENFYLKSEAVDSSINYFLNDYNENKREYLFSSKNNIEKLQWLKDETKVILTLNSNDSNKNSQLLILSTENFMINKEFQNNGASNFIVHGDLLIFDNWKKNKSEIIIYDYLKNDVIDTLSMPGGCGLNYIKSEFIGS